LHRSPDVTAWFRDMTEAWMMRREQFEKFEI
jgi:hypothetical protein